ncbi:putative ankyrin repeat protein L25 [Zancudomyces culisetae]|uniref:Putative ankyrin repeat protein L25 n=1 Tax=Zancudomyces culisetae TaxID=1213189 RepID=A0A1R1PJZ6_ZANCU|nr:putative ankyrin repeat protein L25 [Zancudomyces culisetae]|eukprot:OMH81212.1 putative ankyrin repeat protein L25 [Zancudomyces culisetae]
MYIVVETDTLEIIHKDTAFINENENLDVDINDLLTQKDEEYRFLIDIVASDNFCVRPLVAMSKAWYIMVDCLSDRRYKMALEGLVYISQHPVNLPIAIFEGYNDGIVLSNNKAVIYYFLLGADVVCIAHNFELLKKMLSVSFAANVTLGEIGMFINRLKHSSIWEYVKFIEEYEYENYLNQITFSSCVFYSIKYKRRQFIKHLIGNDTNEIDKQLAFDMSVHFGKCKIATELLAFVEPNYDNINKLVTVAYERNNIELVKELLKNENYTENDIHQHALRTACKNGAFETAQTIINRYPKTVGMVTLLDAIYSGKIELGHQNRMKEENNGIPEVCTSNNGEILDILLSDKYNIEKNGNKNRLPLKSVRNLRFEKVLEFLIIYGLDFDRYYYEMVMARFALKDIKGIEKLLSQIELSSDRATNRNMLKCKSRILEIVGHVIKNDSKGLSVNKKGVEHDFHSQVTENMNSLKGKHQKHQFQEFNTTTSVEGGPMNERFSNDQTAKDILDDEHFQAIKAKLLDRDFDLLKLLIENGAPINSHYFLVLRTAFRAGSIKWIDYFISKGARLGTEGYNGVSEACESGEVAVLRYLLKRGAIVDGESQFNGIKIACKLGNLQMVKLLVEKKADLSDPRYNGIKEACESNSLQILKYLLDKKAIVGDLHHSGLDKACLTGNIELVKMLIKHKVDLHSPKNNGIKEACKANSLEIVKLLVKSGAKPEDVEYNGICEACENNNFELVNFLIKDGGATVDDNFFCGWCPDQSRL